MGFRKSESRQSSNLGLEHSLNRKYSTISAAKMIKSIWIGFSWSVWCCGRRRGAFFRIIFFWGGGDIAQIYLSNVELTFKTSIISNKSHKTDFMFIYLQFLCMRLGVCMCVCMLCTKEDSVFIKRIHQLTHLCLNITDFILQFCFDLDVHHPAIFKPKPCLLNAVQFSYFHFYTWLCVRLNKFS